MTGKLVRLAAVALLCAAAGCHRTPAPVAPPVATAPPVEPTTMTHVPTLPPVPVAETPKVGPPGSDQTAKAPETPPAPKRIRRKKKPQTVESASATPAPGTGTATAAGTASPPAAAAGTTAAAPPPSPVTQQPTLGQLSAGGGADSRERAAMTEEIHAQEARLGGIKHPLSEEAEAIAVQVRAFLAKARLATEENDLDGARTLTMKAKVLLDELSGS